MHSALTIAGVQGLVYDFKMPRKPTGKPPGRPKGDRDADAHCYVRMTSEERQTIERASDAAVANNPMAGKLSVAQWLLRAGLVEARKVLGQK